MPARQDGGALQGGAPRVVWFSSGSDPRTVSARSVAADLAKDDHPAHLVWNPGSGEVVQLVPATRAARLLGTAAGREGRVCVQVMVVGHARAPFTGTMLAGLEPIMRWLDTWGIPRRWLAGPPLPSPQSYHARRDPRDWARGGHFGASQVPGADRPDPGAIDIRRITGPDTPVAPIPKPHPVPAGEAARVAPPATPEAPVPSVPPVPSGPVPSSRTPPHPVAPHRDPQPVRPAAPVRVPEPAQVLAPAPSPSPSPSPVTPPIRPAGPVHQGTPALTPEPARAANPLRTAQPVAETADPQGHPLLGPEPAHQDDPSPVRAVRAPATTFPVG